MAWYDYRCPECRKDFQVEMKPSEAGAKPVECPECRRKEVERVYSSFYAKTSRKS